MTTHTYRGRSVRAASILAAGLALTACETYDAASPNTQRAIGAGLGAAGGYLACRATNANDTSCALMVLAGAAAGYIIVGRLDSRDEPSRSKTLANVLETQNSVGASESYSVPETGATGSVSLAGVSTDAQGRECKELSEVYRPASGDPISETYTMCRGADGRWTNA